MIKLAISGALGRMGTRIYALSKEDKIFQATALLEYSAHPNINAKIDGITVTSNPTALKDSHVLIEFTTPDATIVHLKECVKYGVKMIIGTTGLSGEQIAEIKKASKKIPIVFSSNMSVGVNLVFNLIRRAAEKTGSAYDIRLTEAHHIHKKDAPSGTAKTMAQIAEEVSGKKVSDIKSIREGEIIGDHEMIFESDVDTITISHSAKTRDIFAKGALVAAKFLVKKKTGLFDMGDVLGLK